MFLMMSQGSVCNLLLPAVKIKGAQLLEIKKTVAGFYKKV